MKEDVYWIRIADQEPDEAISRKLAKALAARDFFSFVEPRDMVAFKTHFGEEGSQGYVRPLHFHMMSAMVKKRKGRPFLTETSTLYTGKRSNAVEHMELALSHGFGFSATGMPILMADGLLGNEEQEVEVPGRLSSRVKIAALIVKTQALVVISHFTGHVQTGFAAALKNMGMGCSSRRGKLNQHSTAKPAVKKKKCTGCRSCLRGCPQQAISMVEGTAGIDPQACIGCGECLTVCRFDAIGYNWSVSVENLQKKVVEHAWGVALSKKGKIGCINFLNRITRDCDCLGEYRKIVPDIGVLFGFDPVAVDSASLDLVEQGAGMPLSKLAYAVPCRLQIDYAREIGFGNPDYRLVEI